MPRAIDMHIHPPNEPGAPPSLFAEALRSYFRSGPPPKDADEMADYYRERDILGLLLASDWQSTTGEPPVGNDYVAGIVRKYPQQFLGFCSVDPWRGRAAIDEVRRSVEELGLRGVKFHPSLQKFSPSDPRFFPLWEACAKLAVPLLFHSGMTGIGAGQRGGGGVKTRYCDPMAIDDLAADIPELTIIMAHPAFPWVDEQLAVLLHKANVVMDLSGYSPKYFQPQLIQYANTLLQDRMMFGSDYPSITPDRWLADFQQAPFREEVREKILWGNAARLLNLSR